MKSFILTILLALVLFTLGGCTSLCQQDTAGTPSQVPLMGTLCTWDAWVQEHLW